MAFFKVLIFQEKDGKTPFLKWLSSLPDRAKDKIVVRLDRLAEMGPRLRRPEADYLENGVFELRTKHMGVNYRILYFFHGRSTVVVSHGFAKQQARVPTREIQLANQRRIQFRESPLNCTHEE